MCAGQGRDVLTVARRHRRGGDLVGRLVELDHANVDAARAAIAEAGLRGLEVVEADAGWSDAYEGATPADLVLACGIFGNVSDEDVKTTVELLPSLCASNATVIWTRAPRSDGIVSRIQAWFADAGFASRSLVIGDGDLFAVGAARLVGAPAPLEPNMKLFSFVR